MLRFCLPMAASQRRIGLSGGIASGKSTVARWLKEQGLPVLDADVWLQAAPGRWRCSSAIGRRCGLGGGSAPDAGVINRGALGQIVFNAPQEWQWLEQLVHPLVRQRFNTELAALGGQPAVVLVIPLLFEAGLESLCSEI